MHIQMLMKSDVNKNNWNDSMHIFFSPKLNFEKRGALPKLISSGYSEREQNFFAVFKKPLFNLYEKVSILAPGNNKDFGVNTHINSSYRARDSAQKEKRPVCVIGQPKQFQKRSQTPAQNIRRELTTQVQDTLFKNFQEIQIEAPVQETNIRQKFNKSCIVTKKQTVKQGQEYYFYIGPGNNSSLVEQILMKRARWVRTTSTLFHFRWEQARVKYQNNSLHRQLFNHLPNHEMISDKVMLVNCLRTYCVKNAQEMFGIIPVCFQFNFGDLNHCEESIKRFVEFYWEVQENHNMTMDSSADVDQKLTQDKTSSTQAADSRTAIRGDKLSDSQSKSQQNRRDQPRLSKNIRVYHKELAINIKSVRRKEERKQMHKLILNKIRPHHVFSDMTTLKKLSQFIAPTHSPAYGSTCLWLFKPSDQNRGRGIHLFRTIEELGDLLQTQLANHEKGSFIIQKYIERPMLIDNRKFDIRVYGMVTENKQFYFFKEGYIRTSSIKFNVLSKDYYTHLTNNAIQKCSKKFGKFEQGNVLPLDFLFDSCGVDRENTYAEIKRIVKVTFKASQTKIFDSADPLQVFPVNSNQRGSFKVQNKAKYFQIFGYDFMVDETGHLWLIEVNTNPCLELSSQWLKSIIPRMLDDAFKLTLDRVFPKANQPLPKHVPKHKQINLSTTSLINPEQKNPNLSKKPCNLICQEPQKSYTVKGYRDQSNMWQLLELQDMNQSTIISQISKCSLPESNSPQSSSQDSPEQSQP